MFFGPSSLFLDARSVSSLPSRAREGVGLDRHSTKVTSVVEACDYISRRFYAFFLIMRGKLKHSALCSSPLLCPLIQRR